MSTDAERYCTVTESLEQSLKEMQLMRQGKLPRKTWKEYRERKASVTSPDKSLSIFWFKVVE